jgi:hypothetical protein
VYLQQGAKDRCVLKLAAVTHSAVLRFIAQQLLIQLSACLISFWLGDFIQSLHSDPSDPATAAAQAVLT